VAFYEAGNFGAKKGGVDDLRKLRRGAQAERSNFDLLDWWRFRVKAKFDNKHLAIFLGLPLFAVSSVNVYLPPMGEAHTAVGGSFFGR
jgi:hypothetical protein